jgi:hypothetical protein
MRIVLEKLLSDAAGISLSSDDTPISSSEPISSSSILISSSSHSFTFSSSSSLTSSSFLTASSPHGHLMFIIILPSWNDSKCIVELKQSKFLSHSFEIYRNNHTYIHVFGDVLSVWENSLWKKNGIKGEAVSLVDSQIFILESFKSKSEEEWEEVEVNIRNVCVNILFFMILFYLYFLIGFCSIS